MGILHSSSIVDACIINLVESPFALRHDIQVAYGILVYRRLVGDIFIAAESHMGFFNFYKEYRRLLAPIFTTEVQELSSFKVAMLAVNVCIRYRQAYI